MEHPHTPTLQKRPERIDQEMVNVVFKRDDIRGVYPDQLNAQLMQRIGCALAAELAERFARKPVSLLPEQEAMPHVASSGPGPRSRPPSDNAARGPGGPPPRR